MLASYKYIITYLYDLGKVLILSDAVKKRKVHADSSPDPSSARTNAKTNISRGFAKFFPENSFGKPESTFRPGALPEYLEDRTPNRTVLFEPRERGKPFLILDSAGECISVAPSGATQFRLQNPISISGGEGGIRTPGGLRLNGFQDRRIRPLCHLSKAPKHSVNGGIWPTPGQSLPWRESRVSYGTMWRENLS